MHLLNSQILEWSANAATALSIGLAVWRSILTWPVGIIGCLLFGALFMQSQLYADATLQLFFILTSLIGWQQWRAAARQPFDKALRALDGVTIRRMAAVGLMVTLAYGGLLKQLTDAYAPFWDSAVLVCSVIAQLLLMRGHRSTWPAWILVNTLSVPLYLSRGLQLTALLYSAFWINAWFGWWRWTRDEKAQAA
jgi:nicotinamide mononucleotide transporter